MGWSRGSELMDAVAPSLASVDQETRKKVYQALVDWADMQDWDTHDEAVGIDPVLDKILSEGGYIQESE